MKTINYKTIAMLSLLVFVFLLGFSFSVQAYRISQQELNSPVSQYLRENYGVSSIEEYQAKLEQEIWLNYSRQMEALASQYPELDFSQWQNPNIYRQYGTSTYQPPKITPQQPFYTVIFSEPVTALQVFSLSGLGLIGLATVPPIRKSKRLKQALIIGIVVLCVFSVGYFTGYTVAQAGTIAIEPASLSGDYSYIIETYGTYVWAKSGKTGEVVYGGQWNAGGVSGTDASAVIQSALDALTPNRTWKEKVLIKGNFTVKKQSGKTYAIGLDSYTILEIQGKLTLADNQNCDVIANKDQTNGNHFIEIIGGTIDGNKAHQTSGCGIKFKATPTAWSGPYCYKVTVRDVHVYNCKEHGFSFTAVNDLFVTNCYSGILASFGSGNSLDGFYIDGCHEALIHGCHSIHNGRDGYRCTNTVVSGSWENQIIGCASEDNTGHAYYLYKATTYDFVLHVISGCTCDDCADGVVVEGGRDITVSGNSLSRGSYGVWVKAGEVNVVGNSITEAKQGVRVGADKTTVVGNSIRGKLEADEYGVYLASDVDECLIAMNRITNISTNSGDQAGILLYGNNMHNQIVGNYIYDVGRFGIRLAANAASSYNNIVGNKIYNCATGIGIAGAHTYNIIRDNHVGTTLYYGISLVNGADYNKVEGNTLENCTGGTIYISAAGANNIIRRNVGYDTENFKVTGVSVAVGTGGVYGSASTITSLSGIISYPRVKITWGGTFGTGETVTVKVEAVYRDGSTAYVEESATATGSLWLTDDDVLSLITQGKDIVKLNVYAKSSAASTSVTVTVNAYGKA
jgi:uncharacterized lipoprotein NlpE involved in copper resistance